MPIRTDIIQDRAALAGLSREWNALLRASAANSVFLTWEWAAAWLDVVHPTPRLAVITVRDAGGELLGIAPFYHAPMRFLRVAPIRALRVLGDQFSGSEYPDLILRKGAEDPAIAAIVQALREQVKWDCLWIKNASGQSGVESRFEALCHRGGFPFHRRPCSFAVEQLPESYEAYLATLSGNARSSMRRQAKALRALGSLTLVRCDDGRQTPAMLDTLYRLHNLRWNAVGQKGSFERKPLMRAFYDAFASVALRNDWLALYVLELDGKPLAAQYGYVYDGVYGQMQEGFDPDAPEGAGNVLRAMAIEDLICRGVRTYDFLGGFTEHKRRWGAQEVQGCDLFIGRGGLRDKLLFHKPVWPTGRYLREGGSRAVGPPVKLVARVLAISPHDPDAWTQGLALDGDTLIESTGKYGQSSLRRVRIADGAVLQRMQLPPHLYAEGLALIGDRIIQLTYREGEALVYDAATFERVGGFEYQGEGWGLCFDGARLLMSDGSGMLQIRDPRTFERIGELPVIFRDAMLSKLNDLTVARSWIFANVWESPSIYKIDAESGQVVAEIDCSQLPVGGARSEGEVLNGVAYDPARDVLYLTGKHWPELFTVGVAPSGGALLDPPAAPG